MSRYVNYADYTELLKSSVVPASDWDSCEVPASYYLDQITYGRISVENLPREVKLAVCAVAETNYLESQALNSVSQTVKSFNNDGYSESQYAPDDIRKRYDTERVRALGIYLPRSHPLRYAGV